ncbi:MAG: DegT/DnrJ/EryC1/StrS family aminotransferase, partial [Gemmatimonadaceae bacterium]
MTDPRATTPVDTAESESVGPPVRAGRRWRRLPPAYSPLPLGALANAAGNVLRRHDSRPALGDQLKSTYGAERVALLDSGTHALELALRVAARLAEPGAGIALPAYACFDLATAAVATGLPLMLYDVLPDTLAPNPESLAEAMRAGAGIVVIAPLYGLAVPWDELHAAAEHSGAVLVEDAAQGYGSSWRGRIAGQQTDLSVLSFGRGKGWTGGSGGALMARGAAADLLDEIVADTAPGVERSASTLARATAMSAFVHPSAFALAAALPWLHLGETRYHAPTAPRRLSPAAASLLLASAEHARTEAERRRVAAAWYLGQLADIPGVCPVRPVAGTEGGYLRFPLRVPHGMSGLTDSGRALSLGVAPGYPSPLGELLAVRARL